MSDSCALDTGRLTKKRSKTITATSTGAGPQPIHRLSAVRSALGVRWSHGNLQLLRHPGLPALLQVIDLGANGGRLTTRRMSQKNQSSSNDTSFSFGANAAPAQAINDTPGSQESGGGGTMSYRAAGSIASTSSFTVVNQADVVRGGSARRATSARSPRAARSRIAEDGGGRSPSGTATREDEAGKATTSSKRKPSTSATRNESEARLRRQLQHNTREVGEE